MIDWLFSNQNLLAWLSALSVLTFVTSLIALPWIAGMIPQNYFANNKNSQLPFRKNHSYFFLASKIGKNILGFVILCGGVLMLFLPGQGILTIFIGMFLMDYPGKKVIERRLIGHNLVLKSLNWVRAKGGHPPIKVFADKNSDH